MKFVHAADVHLDSPLRGLEEYPGAPVERLRSATRRAMDNVVQLCLDEQVDFLVIAGDLFDTDCRDFNAALNAAKQMQRLHAARIPVYLILGNHDSRFEMTRQVPWPTNVVVFDYKQPQTILHPTLPVALHGMSYAQREMTQNLVPKYPRPSPERFNIGLLHTNAGANPDHDPYAPCSVEELVAKGYDYWALGHVHGFAELSQRPAVVYPGNTQGRNIREQGAKGCVLVTVNDGEVESIEFRETDVLRWFRRDVPLLANDDEDALLDATRGILRTAVDAADGRLAAVRLEYAGRCAVHQRLTQESQRQQIVANVRALASEVSGDLWIEKIKFRTQSPLDTEALRRGGDLIGQLLRDIDAIVHDPERLAQLGELLQPLESKVGAELAADSLRPDEFQWNDPERLVEWLRAAEQLLLSQLVEDA